MRCFLFFWREIRRSKLIVAWGGDGKIGVFNEKVAKLVQNNVPLSFCNYAILAELSS